MHRSFAFAFIALSLVSSWTAPCQASDYGDGQKLYQQKDYRGAAVKFEAAMKANPRDANTIYYCALAQQMSSNRGRARQLYEYLVSNFAGSQASQMAQTALNQFGPSPTTLSGGSSSNATASGRPDGTGSGGTAAVHQSNSDPAYLSNLPDEVRVPLLRHGGMSNAAYVEVSVNGQPVVFHVDTGAYGTVIGANVLEQMGLGRPTAGQQFAIGGVGDRQDVRGWHQKLDVKLGPIYRRDFNVMVQDYMGMEPLLGEDFLCDFNMTVDDRAGQVIFRKKNARASSIVARGTLDIPYKLDEDGRHLVVEAYVNRKKYDMIFDTGADAVCFGMGDFRKLGIPLPDYPPTGIAHGVMGATNTWSVTLDSLKVGPLSKENFPVSLLESQQMGKPLLGQTFFGSYKYTVDSAKSVIHLVEQ